MKKIKIGVVGASGRMGQEITKIISGLKEAEVFFAVTRDVNINDAKSKSVDVWIDFSSLEMLPEVLKVAAKNTTPVVCGTTGLTAKDKALLKKYSEKLPLLWSSNMSMGIAILNEALKVFEAVKNFDFQIEEVHHNKKKDSPSGTAVTLQENLEQAVGRKLPAPLSIRGGGVFGDHSVMAISDEEFIKFEHRALNRTVFAKGAVRAALWLAKQKKPGLYAISDVLFGKK